jgi:hypothetical protein
MSKHTPGPWTVTGGIVYGNGLRAKLPMNGADAALMAAAPDLLEALQDLCDTLGECGMTEKARAAIAKAEGR